MDRQQDGKPILGATVLLQNKESEFSGSLMPGVGQRMTRAADDGQWSFSDVGEGSYVVTALAPNQITVPVAGQSPDLEPPDREQAYRESRQRFLITQQDVVVTGANLSVLLLAISGPGTIWGAVEHDNGVALPAELVIFLELYREGIRRERPLPMRVKADGSFSVGGIQAGDVYLMAAMPPDSKYFVKSITANGDVLQSKPSKWLKEAKQGRFE